MTIQVDDVFDDRGVLFAAVATPTGIEQPAPSIPEPVCPDGYELRPVPGFLYRFLCKPEAKPAVPTSGPLPAGK